MQISVGHAVHALTHSFERPPGFPYWTLGVISHGAVAIRAAGQEAVKRAPMLSLTAPDSPYAVRFAGKRGRWTEHWAIFSPRREWERLLSFPAMAPLSTSYGALPLKDATLRRKITGAFQEGFEVMRSALPQREALAVNAIERVLLLADTINPQAANARLDGRVRDAVDFIAATLHEPMDVESLSRQARMSPSHFAHLFREQVGRSPMAYVEQQRILRAQELLISTNLAVQEIAHQVGFVNPFHFSTRFRKQVGRSPRAFRENPREVSRRT